MTNELEIARLAKEMEAEYNEWFGEDAIRPDFVESAKRTIADMPMIEEFKARYGNHKDPYEFMLLKIAYYNGWHDAKKHGEGHE